MLTSAKRILSLLLLLSHVGAYAANRCEILFMTPKSGAQILHEKDPTFHMSDLVERAVTKEKQITGKTLTKPMDKLNTWLNYLTSVANKAQSSPRSLEKLKSILYDRHLIKESQIPQAYYDIDVRLARERGMEPEMGPASKAEKAKIAIADQKKSLDYWIEFLVSKDSEIYPMWLKYWMFSGMTKLSKYDASKASFGNRESGTVAPFPELNHEALGLMVDYILKQINKTSLADLNDPTLEKLLGGLNFNKIYGHILSKLGVVNGSFHSQEGKWVTYPAGSSPEALVQSLAGRNTGWCIAGDATATQTLAFGSMQIFYTQDANGMAVVPRVAIKFTGQEIFEIRGVAKDQELDPQIKVSAAMSKKMHELGDTVKGFHKKDRQMKLLTEIDRMTKAGEALNRDQIRFLYELEEKIETFSGRRDPRIEEIRAARDIKGDIVIAFDHVYKRSEITTTMDEVLQGRSKVHIGDLKFTDITSGHALKLPRVMIGNLILDSITTAKGLVLPELVIGDLSLNGLTSGDGLKLPGKVSGSLHLENLLTAFGVKFPDMSGSLYHFLNLPSLVSAEGAIFEKHMDGSLQLGITDSKGLILPETIGALFMKNLTEAPGLRLPSKFVGTLDLRGLTNAVGIIFPEYVPGSFLMDSVPPTGLTLPRVGGKSYLWGWRDRR